MVKKDHPRGFFEKKGFYMEWVSHYVIGRKHCCTDHSLIMRGQLICRITQVRSTSVKSFRQSFQKTIFSNTINIFRNLLNYLFYISRISLRVQRIIFLESIKFFIPFFRINKFVPKNSYRQIRTF